MSGCCSGEYPVLATGRGRGDAGGGVLCRDFAFLAFLPWLGMGALQNSLVARERAPTGAPSVPSMLVPWRAWGHPAPCPHGVSIADGDATPWWFSLPAKARSLGSRSSRCSCSPFPWFRGFLNETHTTQPHGPLERREKETPWLWPPAARVCCWKGKGQGGKGTVPLVTCRSQALRN